MTWKCFSNRAQRHYASKSLISTDDLTSYQKRSTLYLNTVRAKIHYSSFDKNDSKMIVSWGGFNRHKK